MKIPRFYRTVQFNSLIRNYHFWIILALIFAIAIVYYQWKDWFPWFWRYLMFEFTNDIIGIPLLVPFLYASLVFWWRGSLVIWLISAATIMPRLIYYSPDIESLIRNIALSFVPLMAVISIAIELNWREKQRQTMMEREAERQTYMAQIFEAQEDERHRIAQELHDETTQELIVIANFAQSLIADADSIVNNKTKERAEQIRDSILRVSENLRRLSLDLRPSILDNVGLVPALRWLAGRMMQESGINTAIEVTGANQQLRREVEVSIFRMIQEALSNIRRHSKATKARVALQFDSGRISITIRDNGIGFSPSETLNKLTTAGKLGIIGIQQRVNFLNGTFHIESQIKKGTTVTIELNV